jgi:excisionase family DNA binding protein
MTQDEIRRELSEIKKLIEGNEQPLNVEEAAAYLSVGKGYVYKLTASGELGHFKSQGGKKISFLRADLRAWLLKHRVSSREEAVNA